MTIEPDGMVRAFVAVEIPEAVKAGLASAVDALRRQSPPARWTRPEGWHLTLKFLGDASQAQLEILVRDLSSLLSGCPPVRIRLHGCGLFPQPERPRVAWLGGKAPGLESIARAVESAARGTGFARERRPWSLHLTLARIRTRWPRDAVRRFFDWGDGLGLEAFECSEVVLFRSELEPGGAVYTALERLALR